MGKMEAPEESRKNCTVLATIKWQCREENLVVQEFEEFELVSAHELCLDPHEDCESQGHQNNAATSGAYKATFLEEQLSR